MKELVKLFKTKIKNRDQVEKIQITDEFQIVKYKTINDEICYGLYDELLNETFTIYCGKFDAFNDMKELNDNMKEFKEFFNYAIEKAFETRKNYELSKIRF